MAIEIPIAIALMIVSTALLAVSAAAETALERSSEARLHALADGDQRGARRLAGNGREPLKFLGSLTTVRALSAAMLVAGAAWLGAETLGASGALGFGAIAAVAGALIQVTVGNIAGRRPELAAVRLSLAIRAIHAVAWPLAFVLSLPARVLARSLRAVSRDSYDDLLALVEREEAAGGVAESEQRMIRGLFALEQKTVREIMVPRIDMAVADLDDTVADVARLVTERGFSRIPVYRDSIDDITGIVFAKDLLRAVTNGSRQRTLAELMRPVFFIPESKRLDELLPEMQVKRVHMAIVVDEYGGTAGLVTIEDLLEEIVGEIEDEYDVAGPRTEIISDNIALVDGAVSTEVLAGLFGIEVDSEDFDTVGGFVMHHLGRLPVPGDTFNEEGLDFEVLTVRGRRVGQVRIERRAADAHVETPTLVSSRSA